MVLSTILFHLASISLQEKSRLFSLAATFLTMFAALG
jgi:hypothetical protein